MCSTGRSGTRQSSGARMSGVGSPVAAVMPQNGAVFSQEEMEAYWREHLAGYKVPRWLVIVVDVLPRVHGWKLLRRSLRETCCGRGA
jgi:acyl-CoA synthetase (AMP-forming)/AMP-acid ligase II